MSSFAAYILLAKDAGIVDFGGSANDQWISLRPEWSSFSSASSGPSRVLPATSSRTNANAVPAHFKPLIQILIARASSKGNKEVPRTDVGSDLAKQKQIYGQAGVSSFAAYILLAEAAGIVDLGGHGNDQWISLRPEWSSSTTFHLSK